MPDRNGHGLDILHESKDAVVDIVAVHGLGGKRWDTWESEPKPDKPGKPGKPSKMWLNDFLPNTVPDARIMTYGYDARFWGRDRSCQTPYGHGKTLLSRLSTYRQYTKTERRPIIFIVHSLGGIVVKSALIHAHLVGNKLEAYKAIKLSTHAILFFATPHQGSPIASKLELLVRIAKLCGHTDHVIGELKLHSPWLHDQIGQFSGISGDFVTKYFYETIRPIVPTLPAVVPAFSAVVPGHAEAEAIEIRADHRTIVKYYTAEDDAYQIVSMHIALVCQDAPARVKAIWEGVDTSWKQANVPCQMIQQLQTPQKTRASPIKDWILENENFSRWRESETSSILLLDGKAGNGKTELTLSIWAALSRTSESGEAKYYACKRSGHYCHTVDNVLNQTIHQIPRGQGWGELPPASVGSTKVFQQLLRDALTSQGQRKVKYIIVDDYNMEDLPLLIDDISKSQTKWLFTSTDKSTELPNGILHLNLDRCMHHTLSLLEFTGSNNGHIVTMGLAQRSLVDSFLGKAKSATTFLEAELVFGEAKQLTTRPDLSHSTSENLYGLAAVAGFEGLCQQIYTRIKLDLPDAAENIFRCLLLVFKPVTLQELDLLVKQSSNYAVQPDPIQKQLHKCSPFVLIRDDYIYFTHERVTEFLISKLWTDGVNKEAHLNFVSCGLNVVCSGILHHHPRPELYHHLYWLDHAKSLGDKIDDIDLNEYDFFLPSSANLRKKWWDIYKLHRHPPSGVDGYLLSHLAAFCNKPILKRLSALGLVDHQTCLVVAARLGETDIVEELLDLPKSDDLSSSFALYAALCEAAQRSHTGVAKRLFIRAEKLETKPTQSGDANGVATVPKSLDDYTAGWLQDACSTASLQGFDALMELLQTMEPDARQRFVYEKARWPAVLHAVALGGGLDTLIEGLLKQVDGKALDIVTANILRVAIEAGHDTVVRAILRSRPKVNVKAPLEEFGSCLRVAASEGYEDVIEFLIDPNATDDQGVLMSAAARGRADMVKWFTNKYPNLKDAGGVALCVAAQKGHGNIVELLLKSETNNYQDAITAAAARGHTAVVETFCKKLPSLEDTNGRAICAARQGGHLEVINILLEKVGYSVKQHPDVDWIVSAKHDATAQVEQGREGGNDEVKPVSLRINSKLQDSIIVAVGLAKAVRMGNTPLVEFLSEKVEDQFIGNAVETASNTNNRNILKLLLKTRKAEGTTLGKPLGKTLGKVLRTAALRGCLAIVRLLMKKTDEEAKGKALCAAASRGDIAIVQFLLSEKVSVDTQDRKGRRALAVAAEAGHDNMVRLLISNNASVNDKDNDGRTALHLAAKRFRGTIIKFLIDNKADPKLEDNGNQTPQGLALDAWNKTGEKARTSTLQSETDLVEKKLGVKLLTQPPASNTVPASPSVATLSDLKHMLVPLHILIARKVAKQVANNLRCQHGLESHKFPPDVYISDADQAFDPQSAIWRRGSNLPVIVVEALCEWGPSEEDAKRNSLEDRAKKWISGSNRKIPVVLGITVTDKRGMAILDLWRAKGEAEIEHSVKNMKFRDEKGNSCDKASAIKLCGPDFTSDARPLGEASDRYLRLEVSELVSCLGDAEDQKDKITRRNR